jgi:hypothetical protein
MAFINPPPVKEGPLLQTPPRSMAWTLSVAPLQTVAPVSVAFLHGTVKRTNAKELQEAIMSHTVWKGCDIKIVLKSGQLKNHLARSSQERPRPMGSLFTVQPKTTTNACRN